MTDLEQGTARFQAAEKEFTAASIAMRKLISKARTQARGIRPMLTHVLSERQLRAAELVKRTVARFHGIEPDILCGHSRRFLHVEARYQGMALVYQLLGVSFDRAAEIFNREHPIAHHAMRAVTDRCATDAVYRAEFEKLSGLCRVAVEKEGA